MPTSPSLIPKQPQAASAPASQSQRARIVEVPVAPYPPFVINNNQPPPINSSNTSSSLSLGANSSSARVAAFTSLKSSLSSSPHFSKMARHNSTNSAPADLKTTTNNNMMMMAPPASDSSQQLLSASDHAMAAAVLGRQQRQHSDGSYNSHTNNYNYNNTSKGGGRNKNFENDNNNNNNKWTSRYYPSSSAAMQYYPPAIQFISPPLTHHHPAALVASINCQLVDQEEDRLLESFPSTSTASTLPAGGHSMGPNLLVLHQLQLSLPFLSSPSSLGLFQPRPIAISRGNPNMGSGIFSTCLDVYRSGNNSSTADTIACATGLSTGTLCIHTFSSSPHFTSCSKDYFTPRYQRPASAVAWKSHDSKVAIGLLSSSSLTTSTTTTTTTTPNATTTVSGASVVMGGGGAGGTNISPGAVSSSSKQHRGVGGVVVGGGGGNPREFGLFIWDIAHQSSVVMSSSTPLDSSTTSSPSTSSGPLKLSQNVGVTSLAWVHGHEHGPPLLAAGAQMRHLSLYDLRGPSTNMTSAPITISAYPPHGGIHGILSDPLRPHILATFSKTAGEPVKLWDLRRIAEPAHHHTMSASHLASAAAAAATHHTSTAWMEIKVPNQSMVSDIQWSGNNTNHNGATLSVAMDGAIYEYDTWSGPRPTLAGIHPTSGRVLCMAHYPSNDNMSNDFNDHGDVLSTKLRTSSLQMAIPNAVPNAMNNNNNNDDVINENWISELYPHRMLVVLDEAHRTIRDMAKHSNAPLAISPRDGRLAHALGRTLWIGSTSQGPSAMESFEPQMEEDISATMMRRARCLHVARYSMDTAANIQMLAEQMPEFTTSGDSVTSTGSLAPSTRETLVRLWSWIERVEALASESSSQSSSSADDLDTVVWPAKGLIDAGVWQLLTMNKGREQDEVVFSESLACHTYDSSARRAALTACGWAGKYALESVLSECEALGEFERSAALAVWHGDIGAAVEALQRGSDFVRQNQLNDDDAVPYGTLQYAETLQLTSMCVAGYNANIELQSSKASPVWHNACFSLLRRDDLSRPDVIATSRVSYLRGLCRFLMTIGSKDGLEDVLGDVHLSLSDRVAFACRFLEFSELKSFLLRCIASCMADGNAEGLIITGIDKQGIQVLQSYVDQHADVQTAALVSSRVILPTDWSNERLVCLEWLEAYRGLLNTWQMWQSRAMFDVDRAEHLRRIKEDAMSTPSSLIPPHHQQQQPPPGTRIANFHPPRRMIQPGQPGKRQGPRVADSDIMPTLPAQIDARCNYCSVALGLKRQDGVKNQWLSKMKPILSCCPQCRKPLPRCSICLLSLGCLNPYTELTRERSRPVRGGTGLPSPDNLSSLGNLPFAEWITWCMRCKHGGHAHHLVGWFANHETCPVSRCDCRCQFDGIQKLNRPALSRDSASSTNDPE